MVLLYGVNVGPCSYNSQMLRTFTSEGTLVFGNSSLIKVTFRFITRPIHL